MYAKLVNGYPQYAPRRMRVVDSWVYNPTPAMLEAGGYMPVIETPAPEVDEQHYAVPQWGIVDGEIVQSWTVEEIENDDTADKAEAYDILMGEDGDAE